MSVTVLDYLRVLVWPAVVIVLAFAFRAAIRSVLRVRLSQLDAAGISVKFEQAVEQAERLAQPRTYPRPAPPLTRTDPVTGLSVVIPLRYRHQDVVSMVGDAYRDGSNVAMDLGEMPDEDAKRMVDFCAGMIFMARGSIERLHDRVFLLDHDGQRPPEEPALVPAR
jgi:Cell division protein SepF